MTTSHHTDGVHAPLSRTLVSGPDYRRNASDVFWGNTWLWTAILLVIATLLSIAKPVVLPDGGAVTYFSLLFLWLITFFFGPKHGLAVGIVFGFLKLWVTYATGEFVNFAPGALVLEYPLACGLFALGGLVREPDRDPYGAAAASDAGRIITREPVKLRCGYLVGVLAMGVCYVVSAVLFYPPDVEGFIGNLLYCIMYDFSYLIIEAALTMLVLCIPPVTRAIYYLKHVATTHRGDPTLVSF